MLGGAVNPPSIFTGYSKWTLRDVDGVVRLWHALRAGILPRFGESCYLVAGVLPLRALVREAYYSSDANKELKRF